MANMENNNKKSLTLIFTGLGKTKTAAAIGTAMRTIASGGRVIIVYFTGPLESVLGEVESTVAFRNNYRTIGIMSEAKDPSYLKSFSETVGTVKEAVNKAKAIWSYECELLILDNITQHFATGCVDITDVIKIMEDRLPTTSIIITGLNAPESLIDKADVVTDFLITKQPIKMI